MTVLGSLAIGNRVFADRGSLLCVYVCLDARLMARHQVRITKTPENGIYRFDLGLILLRTSGKRAEQAASKF